MMHISLEFVVSYKMTLTKTIWIIELRITKFGSLIKQHTLNKLAYCTWLLSCCPAITSYTCEVTNATCIYLNNSYHHGNCWLNFRIYPTFFLSKMSEAWKLKRAEQARNRRAKKKQQLAMLRREAFKTGASLDLKNRYLASVEKRNCLLEYDKKRAAASRNKLKNEVARAIPSAIKKASEQKKAKRKYNSRNKTQMKMRNFKAVRRAEKKFSFIKGMIEREGKDVNKPWVPYKRALLTPLGAAVKSGDLAAVSYLLEKKASLSRKCNDNLAKMPLYEAAWCGKPKIMNHLLNFGDHSGLSFGALHGAIHQKMFSSVNIFLQKGCDVNEYFCNTTPLGVALTCGKANSGDVRLVKRLIAARADITNLVKLSKSILQPGEGMTSVINLADKFSNRKCLKLIKSEYLRRGEIFEM